MANNTRGSCVSKAWKPPSSRLILIYFKFRSKPSLITVICMDLHSPIKLFATKYCFLILGDEFLFLNHFFIFPFFCCCFMLFCYYLFLKKLCYYYHVLIIFFSWKLLSFFHVPGCSGMFRNVTESSNTIGHVPDLKRSVSSDLNSNFMR